MTRIARELIKGVRQDFLTLIEHNSRKGSYGFEEFIISWNELKFYYIFSGRKDVEEMKFFVEHSLMLAKDLFLRSHQVTDLERTSALYLLHAFYMSQPLLKRVKIRIEFVEIKNMVLFVNRMKSVTKEIPYAFYTLVQQDAFHYVYSYLKRVSEKTGVVDVRDFSTLKEKPVIGRKEINDLIKDIFGQVGFSIDKWAQFEALYNAELEQIKKEHKSKFYEGDLSILSFLGEIEAAQKRQPPSSLVSGKKNVRRKGLERRHIDSDSVFITAAGPTPPPKESGLPLPLLPSTRHEENQDLNEALKLPMLFDGPSTSSGVPTTINSQDSIKHELYELPKLEEAKLPNPDESDLPEAESELPDLGKMELPDSDEMDVPDPDESGLPDPDDSELSEDPDATEVPKLGKLEPPDPDEMDMPDPEESEFSDLDESLQNLNLLK